VQRRASGSKSAQAPRKNNFPLCRRALEQTCFSNNENSEALIDNWSLKIGHRQLKLPMANFQFSILNSQLPRPGALSGGASIMFELRLHFQSCFCTDP
jgi:hypothetical protein